MCRAVRELSTIPQGKLAKTSAILIVIIHNIHEKIQAVWENLSFTTVYYCVKTSHATVINKTTRAREYLFKYLSLTQSAALPSNIKPQRVTKEEAWIRRGAFMA